VSLLSDVAKWVGPEDAELVKKTLTRIDEQDKWNDVFSTKLIELLDTVMRGGDTDTNAAIAGALLGAAYGRHAVPSQWVTTIQSCRPKAGEPRVRRPRPECLWPVDTPELARMLLGGGS